MDQVFVKRIPKTNVMVERDILIEMKQVRASRIVKYLVYPKVYLFPLIHIFAVRNIFVRIASLKFVNKNCEYCT